jgi:hypothetical protein
LWELNADQEQHVPKTRTISRGTMLHVSLHTKGELNEDLLFSVIGQLNTVVYGVVARDVGNNFGHCIGTFTVIGDLSVLLELIDKDFNRTQNTCNLG